MKRLIVLMCIVSVMLPAFGKIQDPSFGGDDSDNDFADFDDFDGDDDFVSTSTPKIEAAADVPGGRSGGVGQQKAADDKNSDFTNIYENYDNDDDGIVEEEDNEFEHFKDEEEFEGFAKGEQGVPVDQKTGEPKLTMAKVPLHFRTHWDSYWMEMLMMAGLLAYFANYFMGKNKNSKLANLWLSTHRSLLEDNFVLIGDDGGENEGPVGFVKESESLYTLWCSGRTCCEGMLVELKMIKRQDLVAVVSDLIKPAQDQLNIKIEISKDAMDTFVFFIGSRRTTTKYFKDMYDLNKFCALVSSVEKYSVPNGFGILSEIPEATSAILDSRVLAALSKFGHLIDYIYITDQYNGVVQQDDSGSTLKMPEVKKQLMASFNLPKASDMELAKPLLVLIFYLLEKIKRYRLSKEGKNRAERNRQRVEEEFLKSTHSARAEAAALRREEKRKQEKERVMADDDPEKQRRWEKKEQKRQLKRKAPKMKQLSVKAL